MIPTLIRLSKEVTIKARTPALIRAAEQAATEAKALEKTRELQRHRATIKAELDRLTSKYPAKKEWPPDFSQLSPQRQFAYEKKWKRRMIMKQGRTPLEKRAALWQYFLGLGLVAYVFAYGEFEWNGKRYRFMSEAKHRFGYLWGYMEPDQKHVRNEDIIHVLSKERKEKKDIEIAAMEAAVARKAATA